MNESSLHPHVEEHPRQEAEKVNTRRAVLIAVVALAIFALAVYEADRILHQETKALAGSAPIPSEVGQPEIGMVNQRLFELQREAEELRAEQVQRLNSYGWVDRNNEIIHIPIEQAMEALVSRSNR